MPRYYRNQLLIDFNQRPENTEKGSTGLYYQSIRYAVEFNLAAANNDRGVD